MKLTAPWTKLRCFAPPTAGNKGPQWSHMCELRKRCWHKCGDDITISCAFGLIHAPSQMYHFHPFNLPFHQLSSGNSVMSVSDWVIVLSMFLGTTLAVSLYHFWQSLPACYILCPWRVLPNLNSSLFNLMFLPPWSDTLSPMCILPAIGSTF